MTPSPPLRSFSGVAKSPESCYKTAESGVLAPRAMPLRPSAAHHGQRLRLCEREGLLAEPDRDNLRLVEHLREARLSAMFPGLGQHASLACDGECRQTAIG